MLLCQYHSHLDFGVGMSGISKGLNEGNAMVSESQLTFLRSIDTPTVCNLIEIVAPGRRGAGYTASYLHCPFPDLPPMVGFAKTAIQ
jgi:hypothetical protein